MSLTVDQLESAISMLRRQKVKAYTDIAGGGFTVEFFPDEPVMPPETKKLTAEHDACPCGHPEHAHVNGYCIEGCGAAACNPVKK